MRIIAPNISAHVPLPNISTEEKVIETLACSHAQVMTAQELVTNINRCYSKKVRLDSLSSKLKRMVDEYVLLRVKGYGPRGGYGYLLNPNYKDF